METIDDVIIAFHCVASFICWFCLLLMFCYGIVMEQHLANKPIVIFGSIAIILFFCQSASFLLVYAKIIDININYVRDTFTATTNQIAIICTFLAFLGRLKYSFKQTKYESNNCIFIIFSIMIFIYFLCGIILNISFGEYKKNNIDLSLYLKIVIIILISMTIIDLLFSFGVTLLFFKKLWRLNIDYMGKHNFIEIINNDIDIDADINDGDMESVAFSIGSNNRKFTLSPRQKSIMHIMSKMTILVSISIIFEQLLMIYVTIINIAGIYKWISWDKYQYKLKIIAIIWAIEIIMNSLCILLSFDAISFWYGLICGKFHKYLSKSCIFLAKKRLLKQIKSSSSQSLGIPLLTELETGIN